MNIDEKFHRRWEFRRKEVDLDTSSDDSQSIENKRLNIVTDLVLLENDEARDKQQTVQADKNKIRSRKKKNVAWNISNGTSVKKISKNKNPKNEETAIFKDLKVFADSLIQELVVYRENMFAHMNEEMRKMGSKPIKKNVISFQKKNSIRQKGNIGSLDRNVKSNVGSYDRVLEITTKNDKSTAHMNLAKGSDQVVSSSYFTLPTIIPKPPSQNQRNHFSSNDRIHTPPGAPMSGSNIASLGFCENAFADNNELGRRVDSFARFSRGNTAFSDQIFSYIANNNVSRKSDGEFVSVRPLQELRDGQI